MCIRDRPHRPPLTAQRLHPPGYVFCMAQQALRHLLEDGPLVRQRKTLVAVSYTHLDVYKRQACCSAPCI